MKYLYLLPCAFLFISCSPRIHKHFEHNRYAIDYNTVYVNDSLEIGFESPADISYTAAVGKVKKATESYRKAIPGTVVAHGSTNTPSYEFFISTNDIPRRKSVQGYIHLDTLIGHTYYHFTGIPHDEKARIPLRADLQTIYDSFRVGEGYRKRTPPIYGIMQKYSESNRYLSALEELLHYPAHGRQEKGFQQQIALTYASFLGPNATYYKLLQDYESSFVPKPGIVQIIQANGLNGSKVKDRLMEEAAQRNLVMINENHFIPGHRKLIRELLPRFREAGFTYLALEALASGQDSVLNQPGTYPSVKNGFYTKEAEYARLLREAKRLGFQFVAYDSMNPNTDREALQALNLFDRTFAANPGARVLVLAGYDHILEAADHKGKKWMASIFRENYDIDPLTISQTHLHLYRNSVSAALLLVEPSHLQENKYQAVDFHLLNNYGFGELDAPAEFIYRNKTEDKLQLALFYREEMDSPIDQLKSIPVYSRLLLAGEETKIPLPSRDMVLLLFDKDRNLVERKEFPAGFQEAP